MGRSKGRRIMYSVGVEWGGVRGRRIMYSVGVEWEEVREGDNVLCRGGMGRR